jgi:hypothetical protein
MTSGVHHELLELAKRLLPRMLSQMCRDPGHPGYGSFDRNWWHYKIRDFSSIILQQGGYACYCASRLPEFKHLKGGLEGVAASSCRFWNDRAVKRGAFEEYYPWEQGYPPLAFSSLSVAKMVAAGIVAFEEVADGLKVAASQLLAHFESEASNQQVAGTAALCWIRHFAPELVDEPAFEQICLRTLACQHQEGWYAEYGGPDLGYLAVTMDCLWDAYDATGDERFRASAARALDFIVPFVSMPQCGAGMFNARNTDYIVPYGIARFLDDVHRGCAAEMVLERVFANLSGPAHFLHAVDDRYYCHYIGHSIFRSIALLAEHELQEKVVEPVAANRFFEGTGQWLISDTPARCAAVIGGKKGGILSLDFDGVRCVDYGWLVVWKGKEWVSHWWGDFWKIERKTGSISIAGHMVPHLENNSTPFKHLVLRVLSRFFGRRIIGMLKERMIFKNKVAGGIPFKRKIEFTPSGVEVLDWLGVGDVPVLKRAPRSSKRHVASADSFHEEDMGLVDAKIVMEESRTKKDGGLEIRTFYRSKT